MADRVSPPRPPSGDPGEDFLFHLYRGGELLQDNRVVEARVELEQALELSPADPQGQDLLGVVYFRLGLYPRAIAIYEKLVLAHPESFEPRVNLALCFLKTGQPARARLELERVVAQHANHQRAWGYLGLAHQALGDTERALHAFTRGGHEAMARRLADATGGTSNPQRKPSMPPGSFTELDRTMDLNPSSALPQSVSAGWDALLAAAEGPPARATPAANATTNGAAKSDSPPRGPLSPTDLGRRHTLTFPAEGKIAAHPGGVLLVAASSGFAVRPSLVRSMAYTNGLRHKSLMRRMRGKSLEEPLGGEGDVIVELEGRGDLVLAPPPDHELVSISLEEEPLYLREDLLGGFEGAMSYENGRMPVGDGEAVGMVQLRGPGTLVARLKGPMLALDVREGKSSALYAPSVLGWMGRVIPRALPPSEAPAGAKSFVVFSGEGTVLLHGR
ncbi:tetratricopeptide repeat protein [Polyangium jinanense]|uniref:tetratricopeptide repeat protein n=1 Tax=Polyangium jinanense TaxID=2829994 RepID=UPI0023407F2C|nr:tetratricopeptide repeat protein [Polyangium jinanense]MDC3959389.1 tetratricopeptide repeat protein [Polyangium jinanense]